MGFLDRYFAATGLLLVVALAGWSVARRRRLRSRFLACDRLRVFSRALSLGAMIDAPFGLLSLIVRSYGDACRKGRNFTANGAKGAKEECLYSR